MMEEEVTETNIFKDIRYYAVGALDEKVCVISLL